MAKPFSAKPTSQPGSQAPGRSASPPPSVSASTGRSDIRNSPLPKSATPAGGKQITREMIALRAYEIWKSGKGGSDYDNWIRAEKELRAGM